MRTLQEIVRERIARTASLMGDMDAMMREAHNAEQRMARRTGDDPSLDLFVTHYADGIAAALKAIPAPMHNTVLKSMLMQIVTEWEDVHQEFSNQLTPHS